MPEIHSIKRPFAPKTARMGDGILHNIAEMNKKFEADMLALAKISGEIKRVSKEISRLMKEAATITRNARKGGYGLTFDELKHVQKNLDKANEIIKKDYNKKVKKQLDILRACHYPKYPKFPDTVYEFYKYLHHYIWA